MNALRVCDGWSTGILRLYAQLAVAYIGSVFIFTFWTYICP